MKPGTRKAHTRKHRRLDAARLRTGKKIVRHKALSGRTGTAHSKKLKTRQVKQ